MINSAHKEGIHCLIVSTALPGDDIVRMAYFFQMFMMYDRRELTSYE